jgi:hypothetical protein
MALILMGYKTHIKIRETRTKKSGLFRASEGFVKGFKHLNRHFSYLISTTYTAPCLKCEMDDSEVM